MKRDFEDTLYRWKKDPDRKPILLSGMMGCGKSWCLKIFGQLEFTKVAYLDFGGDKQEELRAVFEQPSQIRQILHQLSVFVLGEKIVPGKTLLILDQVQLCPDAIDSLRYFSTQMPQLHVIAAGRSLGMAMRGLDVADLVEKVTRYELGPLSFEEFVRTCGGQNYLEELKTINIFAGDVAPIPALYAKAMQRYLREYFVVGGMPEAVDVWQSTHDAAQVDKVQKGILRKFQAWGEQAGSAQLASRIDQIFHSMPQQLTGKSHKFQYCNVQNRLRAKDLDKVLRLMEDAGMLLRQEMVAEPETPLSFAADSTFFRMYLPDVGLQRVVMGIDAQQILSQEGDLPERFSALTEAFVCLQLREMGHASWFWRSGNIAELDCLIELGGEVIPIDLKSISNTKSKSLRSYIQKYQPPYALRLSMNAQHSGMQMGTRVMDLPLYLLLKDG